MKAGRKYIGALCVLIALMCVAFICLTITKKNRFNLTVYSNEVIDGENVVIRYDFPLGTSAVVSKSAFLIDFPEEGKHGICQINRNGDCFEFAIYDLAMNGMDSYRYDGQPMNYFIPLAISGGKLYFIGADSGYYEPFDLITLTHDGSFSALTFGHMSMVGYDHLSQFSMTGSNDLLFIAYDLDSTGTPFGTLCMIKNGAPSEIECTQTVEMYAMTGADKIVMCDLSGYLSEYDLSQSQWTKERYSRLIRNREATTYSAMYILDDRAAYISYYSFGSPFYIRLKKPRIVLKDLRTGLTTKMDCLGEHFFQKLVVIVPE